MKIETKITIEIDDKTFELTKEQAIELYIELGKNLNKDTFSPVSFPSYDKNKYNFGKWTSTY